MDVLFEIGSGSDIYTSMMTEDEEPSVKDILLKFPLIEPIMRTKVVYDDYDYFLRKADEKIVEQNNEVKTLARVK